MHGADGYHGVGLRPEIWRGPVPYEGQQEEEGSQIGSCNRGRIFLGAWSRYKKKMDGSWSYRYYHESGTVDVRRA